MKKNLWVIVIATLVLTACTASNTQKKADPPANTVSKSSKPKTREQRIVASSSSIEERETSESYQYEVESEGERQIVRKSIVYKGEKFLKLDVHITHKATEATKESFAGYEFETVKGEMISYLENKPEMQQIRAMKGVVVGMDVTADYDVIVHLQLDMQQVDLESLASIEGLGSDFHLLKDITPAEYILGLKLNGATAVTQ